MLILKADVCRLCKIRSLYLYYFLVWPQAKSLKITSFKLKKKEEKDEEKKLNKIKFRII